MARSRGRSRGTSLPALGGTLGSLVRSTLAQAGVVKDVLERGAREGKARLDDARRERRREQALARLGEAVLDALRVGEAQELLDRAEVADALAEVEDLERGEEREPRARERERDRDREAWVAPTRERYDRADDDGTVSSKSWRPPARPAARPEPVTGGGDARPPRRPAEEPGARFQERRRPGGIQFEADGDEDLADYMHPDDLPPRGS